jgi:hypothetical protein
VIDRAWCLLHLFCSKAVLPYFVAAAFHTQTLDRHKKAQYESTAWPA